jgi:O-antigen/teichoic acid export membrane protein
MSWSVLANVVLNVALIPHFGATGAACATASSIVLWNAVLSYEVRRQLGIDPGVIGIRIGWVARPGTMLMLPIRGAAQVRAMSSRVLRSARQAPPASNG